MMVVMALLTVIMAGMYVMLSQSTRYMRGSEAYATAQFQAHRAVRRLVRDMSSSVDRWTVLDDGFVRFLSAESSKINPLPVNFDPVSGRVMWRKWVGYYHDVDSRTLVRCEVPLTTEGPGLLAEPAPALLKAGFMTLPSSSKSLAAQHVESFSAVSGGVGTYDVTVETLVMAAVASRTEQQKEARIRLTSRIVMVNHYP